MKKGIVMEPMDVKAFQFDLENSEQVALATNLAMFLIQNKQWFLFCQAQDFKHYDIMIKPETLDLIREAGANIDGEKSKNMKEKS